MTRITTAWLVGVSSVVLLAAQAAPIKAVGSIDLKDAAGDMGPITTSSGNEPPLDVVNLSIKSDGAKIAFTATMKDALGSFATAPVTIYLDTDNKPDTGIKGFAGRPGGFEYKVELDLCIHYADGSEACAGGSTKSKPTERWGAIDLKHFKGDSEYGNDDETVIDSMGFPGSKASAKVPVVGQTVQGAIDYSDIKVKPGQTIRILARETGGSPKDGDGAFPIVVLTLK